MQIQKRIAKAAGAVAAVASLASLPLVAKVDLSRETPVAATEQIPLVDFFRRPILEEPQLNLEGTHIGAILNVDGDHSELLTYDLKTQAIDRIGARGTGDISGFHWTEGKRLIFSVSEKKMWNQGIFGAQVGALKESYPILQFTGSYVLDIPPGDRTHPVVHLSANTGLTGQYGEVAVLRTDITTGKYFDASAGPTERNTAQENNIKHIVSRYPILKTNQNGDFRYLTDREGKLAFGFENRDGALSLHRLVGDQWQDCPIDLEEVTVLGAGNNPGELVVVAARKDGKPRPLQIVEGSTGKVLDTLWEDAGYDFNGWLYRDSVTNALVGAMGFRNGPYSVWFTEGYRALQKAVDKMMPGQVVRIRGTDAAGKLVLIESFSDRQPGVYSWVDLEKKTAGAFRNSRPWIDAQRMQPMSIMKFKTRDGKSFDACVTLPKGVSKQAPAPLVVLPHDRSGFDSWGFNETVQFLASRGYAVLQPNFRGSQGQTWMYPTSDEWEFVKMHEDVTDAVKTLFATGLIDRNRVAIVGTTQFGGYLALCGVALEPQLYRCAATQSAVYDWGELIQDQEYFKYQGNFFARYSLKLGDPKKNQEKFAAMSPLKHARDIRVPVLLSYGEFEVSSQISLAKEIASTVRSKGLEAETLSFPDEWSGMNYLDHKIEFYQRLESFLAKNMGGAAP